MCGVIHGWGGLSCNGMGSVGMYSSQIWSQGEGRGDKGRTFQGVEESLECLLSEI